MNILLIILISCHPLEEVKSPLHTDLEIIEAALKYPEVRSFLKGHTYLMRSHSETDLLKDIQGPLAGFDIKPIEYAFERNFRGVIGITRPERLIESISITIWAGDKGRTILLDQDLRVLKIDKTKYR